MKVCIKETKNKGKGIFAKRDIKKREIILKRSGKIITIKNLKKILKYIQDHWFPVGENRYMLPYKPSMYTNHSCNPNSGITNNHELIAMRNIKKDEEITYDYAIVGADDWTMKCKCGSKNCRKIIGKYKNLPDKLKKKYSKYTPDWIKKIR